MEKSTYFAYFFLAPTISRRIPDFDPRLHQGSRAPTKGSNTRRRRRWPSSWLFSWGLWRLYGYYMVIIWLLYGYYMVIILFLYSYYTVIILLWLRIQRMIHHPTIQNMIDHQQIGRYLFFGPTWKQWRFKLYDTDISKNIELTLDTYHEAWKEAKQEKSVTLW